MPHDPPDFEILVTAEEAWPAFERAVLHAQKEILAGFRIFDLSTKLRSEEAKEVGEDWYDLLTHVVAKGVNFKLILSDFDAVMGTPLHELTWTTVRQGAALAEMAQAAAGQVEVIPALHAARAGALPWMALLPAVVQKQLEKVSKIKDARLERQAVHLDAGSLPELRTVTHHQKLAVIDDDVLYLGGLDLNERRYDTPDHDRASIETWSDVQVILRNAPEVADAKRHLQTFLDVTDGKIDAPKLKSIKRTLSAPRRIQFPFLSPRTVAKEIEEAHLDAFRSAKHLIHLETQFLRSSVVSETLAEEGAKRSDLHLVVILPALPDDVAFEGARGIDAQYGMGLQKEAIETLNQGFGERATICAPVRPVFAAREGPSVLAGSPIIYVHNKVLIRDDDYAMIGSANLNGRSMRWDTEAAVEITQPERMSQVRERLFRHWWFDPLPEEAKAPATMQQWWAKQIERNRVVRPEKRAGFLVPHDNDKLADQSQNLPLITEDVV